MKEAEFTVEFNTHVLANNIHTKDNVNIFQRNTDGSELIFQASWWYTAFNKAIQLLKVRGVKPSDITVDLSVSAPTSIYNRRYGRGEARDHEAIPAGSRVTFKALLADHITESTLEAILAKLGSYIGISPFGHNLGYGKFTVVNLTVKTLGNV